MIEEMTAKAAESLASQMEAEFGRYIETGWSTAEIRRRCKLVKVVGQEHETLHVDGKPVLEIYPMQAEQKFEDDRVVVRFTQNFRRLT